MTHLTNIVKKELRELLTPGSVVSVLLMVMLFAFLGSIVGGEVDKVGTLSPMAVVDDANGEVDLPDGTHWSLYGSMASLYGKIPEGKTIDDYLIRLDSVTLPDGSIDRNDLASKMAENGLTSAVLVPDDFAERIAKKKQAHLEEFYLYEAEGMFGSAPSITASSMVGSLNTLLSSALVGGMVGADAGFYLQPIRVNESGSAYIGTMVNGSFVRGVTPMEISSQVSSQTMMVPLVIMIIIMMVGSIVISSMGSEKENKTLETLLTLPIRRTVIVTGKIVAAAIVGLVYGLAYMVGMSFYMNALTREIVSGVNLDDIGLGLDLTDYALLMTSMFLAIVCALGICMIMGAFAKNYKSAQTMTMPLSILSMIPAFVIMFSGWYGASAVMQGILFAIPFSHPMIAMQALMYNDYLLVLSGIAYMAVFAAVAIAITVRLYNSDILITGLGQTAMSSKLFGNRRKSGGSR
ncbi:MAG: ABC transporter permease [Candidatus Methanomethylophilaceae archaeon]|nr:ABC transporter permease [Candidatus Methanomethylophilaceae archaeon]